MTYYYFTDSRDSVIVNTLPESLQPLLVNTSFGVRTVKESSTGADIVFKTGKKSNDKGTVVIISREKKFLNSSKRFNEALDHSLLLLDVLYDILTQNINLINVSTRELIHNLTELSTYNIQNMYSVLPQHVLTENINRQKDIVKEKFNKQPNIFSGKILDVLQNNMAMKVEFSVFNKLLEPFPSSQKLEHDIHRLILSVLQVFYVKFESLGITIEVHNCNRDLVVDYECLTVSFFYLFENATKYCCPRSKLVIKFEETYEYFKVIIDMKSIEIKENEKNQLCDFSFRSDAAKVIDGKGSGIGLNRVVKTLRMNDAELEISTDVSDYSKRNGGVIYKHNLFAVKFNQSTFNLSN